MTWGEHSFLIELSACDGRELNTFNALAVYAEHFQSMGLLKISHKKSKCFVDFTTLGWLYIDHPELPLPGSYK